MKKLKLLIVTIFVTVLINGCVTFRYPVQNHYMLCITKPQPVKTIDKVIEVNSINIAPQFSGSSFVYRRTNINYLEDYYNRFFHTPSQQFYQVIVNYLRDSKLFRFVSIGEGILLPDYILQPEVVKLYADYRDHNKPKAIMVIKFVCINKHNNKILFNKTFSQAVPLKCKDSAALIKAWSQGMQSILRQLVQGLVII